MKVDSTELIHTSNLIYQYLYFGKILNNRLVFNRAIRPNIQFTMPPEAGTITFSTGTPGYILGTFNLLFAFLTVSENFLLVTAIRNIAKRRQWGIPDILIGSIAISDLLTGLICQPLHSYFVLRQRNVYDPAKVSTREAWILLIMNFFSYFLCGASLLLVAVMSVDRLSAIARPMKYRENASKARIIIIIAIVFLISFIIPVFRFASKETTGIFTLLLIIAVSLALITTLVSYSLLLYFYNKHRRAVAPKLTGNDANASKQYQHYIRQQKRLTKSFAIIGFLLILMYLPQLIIKPISLAVFSSEGKFSSTLILVEDILNTILYCNSFLNPLIYSYHQKDIRQEIRRILSCRELSLTDLNSNSLGRQTTTRQTTSIYRKQTKHSKHVSYAVTETITQDNKEEVCKRTIGFQWDKEA